MKKLFKLGCGAVIVVVLIVMAVSLGGGGDSVRSTLPTMYFCGYDRCPGSGEYGKLIFETGINVWNGPDPDRGGIHHKASNGDRVEIVETKRVSSGAGGLWYQLKGGGWTNDLWLTDTPCTAGSAKSQHKLDDC